MALRVIDGRGTIAAAGTPVAVGSGNAIAIAITANEGNSGMLVVGGAGVVAAIATRTGRALKANDVLSLTGGMSGDGGLLDLARIYVDGTVNGDQFHYMALIP